MGAYSFLNDLLQARMGLPFMEYFGRIAAASPATGSKKMHKIEQEQILSAAIGPLADGDSEGDDGQGQASKGEHAKMAS